MKLARITDIEALDLVYKVHDEIRKEILKKRRKTRIKQT